jgi:hypothetical protein
MEVDAAWDALDPATKDWRSRSKKHHRLCVCVSVCLCVCVCAVAGEAASVRLENTDKHESVCDCAPVCVGRWVCVCVSYVSVCVGAQEDYDALANVGRGIADHARYVRKRPASASAPAPAPAPMENPGFPVERLALLIILALSPPQIHFMATGTSVIANLRAWFAWLCLCSRGDPVAEVWRLL